MTSSNYDKPLTVTKVNLNPNSPLIKGYYDPSAGKVTVADLKARDAEAATSASKAKLYTDYSPDEIKMMSPEDRKLAIEASPKAAYQQLKKEIDKAKAA